MIKNDKFKVIAIFTTVFIIGIYLMSNIAIVSVYLDGQNVSAKNINPLSGFNSNNNKFQETVDSHLIIQIDNLTSDSNSIKDGINTIARDNGFIASFTQINSPYGSDQIPMPITVSGTSMVPTLKDGELIIIQKTDKISVGDIVVSKHPSYNLIVKRVGAINGSQVYLISDNKKIEYINEGGITYKLTPINTWVNQSDIVGIVRVFNVNNN
ncbi:MAG: S24/S26 family peptidase [Methanobacteriaceae archaeon]